MSRAVRFAAGAALLFAGLALAQEESVANSPRAALEYFLNATRAGRYDQATTVFPSSSASEGAELARDLRAVMDEYLTIDLAKVSDSPEGRLDDHLPPNVDEIGRIPFGNGSQPIWMVREASGKWVFSPTTLARAPNWYGTLPDRWIRSLLPRPLLNYGPRDLLWWQWLALLPVALLSLALGALLALLARLSLRWLAQRTTRNFDTELLHRLVAPLILLAAAFVGHVATDQLFFTRQAVSFANSLVSAAALLAVFWGALRCVDLGIGSLRESSFARGRPERLALLPLFSKAGKIVLAAAAVVEVLQRLGYPAASLIAGLGIGGLAVALAAQKTLENVFGSVILAVDQPFRPGDTVKVDDVTGTVESVGLRSTRIRTASRTIVTLPNGRLADMRIESFAPRDRIRIEFTLGLVHSTGPAQLRKILADITGYLAGVPRARSGSPTVYLTGLSSSSLDMLVAVELETTNDETLLQTRQEILLRLLEIVALNGSALAMPARAVHLSSPRAEPSHPPGS